MKSSPPQSCQAPPEEGHSPQWQTLSWRWTSLLLLVIAVLAQVHHGVKQEEQECRQVAERLMQELKQKSGLSRELEGKVLDLSQQLEQLRMNLTLAGDCRTYIPWVVAIVAGLSLLVGFSLGCLCAHC